MPTTTGKRGIAGALAVAALFAAGLFVALESDAGAETLAKTGLPSRAEITDAAMGERAMPTSLK